MVAAEAIIVLIEARRKHLHTFQNGGVSYDICSFLTMATIILASVKPAVPPQVT
jgi:hypothetical protein